MNNKLKLYVDFIELFKDLKYKEIPVPIFCKFDSYIEPKLQNQLNQNKFSSFINSTITSESDIQLYIDQQLIHMDCSPYKKKDNGKILLYEFVLRFPPVFLKTYFSHNQTIILRQNEGGIYFDITVCSLKEFEKDNEEVQSSLLTKARNILSNYGNHPIFGSIHFQTKFLNDIPLILRNLMAIDSFFLKNSISSVFIGTYSDEDPNCKMIALIARLHGVPSFCMQHGVMGAGYWGPSLATKEVVYGNYEKEYFKSIGVTEEKIEIAGHPQFDSIFMEKHLEKQDFMDSFQFDPFKKIIFICPEPFVNDSYWVELIGEISTIENIEIIVKPHPHSVSKGEIDEFVRLKHKYSNVTVLEKHVLDVYSILPNVDIVVLDLSTLGLEAILFNKHVVFYRPVFISGCFYDYYGEILNEFVRHDPLKTKELIKKLLTDEDKQKFSKQKRAEFLSYAYPHKLAINNIDKLIKKYS